MASNGPYRPDNQNLGGTPKKTIDIPICAVFIFLYIIAGGVHQKLVIGSQKAGRKFPFCGMMAGLCWIRIITCSLRIAWSFYPENIKLGIAAQVFVNIGTVLLYFVDLFFVQRIIRAQHPRFGWSKPFTPVIPALCILTILTVIAVIAVSIQSFYTLDPNILRIDRDIQLYVETCFSVIAFLPLVLVLISTLVRQIPHIKHTHTTDKFGMGSMRTKIVLLCIASFILGAADTVKAVTSYLPPTPLFEPGSNGQTPEQTPWYFNRGIFYGLGLAPEIIVLYMYMLSRVDKRFVIPDGASRPYSYAGGFTFAGEAGNEKSGLGQRDSLKNLVGSSPSLAQSSNGRSSARTSMSRGRASVISWGGVYHGDITPTVGEDGSEIMPYSRVMEGEEHFELPPFIAGAEQEMGWDSRSGKWQLRPVSTLSAKSSRVYMQGDTGSVPAMPEMKHESLPSRKHESMPITKHASSRDMKRESV